MTADEWNAKHPIGTRVLKPFLDNERGFTESHMRYSEHFDANYVYVAYDFGIRTYEFMGRFIPISAYPGDMYTGQPLKKVRKD